METEERLLDRLQERVEQLGETVDRLGLPLQITGLVMIYGEEATPTPQDRAEWAAQTESTPEELTARMQEQIERLDAAVDQLLTDLQARHSETEGT